MDPIRGKTASEPSGLLQSPTKTPFEELDPEAIYFEHFKTNVFAELGKVKKDHQEYEAIPR